MLMREFFKQLGLESSIPQNHPILDKFLVILEEENEDDNPEVTSVSQVLNCVYVYIN